MSIFSRVEIEEGKNKLYVQYTYRLSNPNSNRGVYTRRCPGRVASSCFTRGMNRLVVLVDIYDDKSQMTKKGIVIKWKTINTTVTIGVAQSVVFCVCVVFCKQVFLFHLAILSLFFFELRLDFLVAFGIFKLVTSNINTWLLTFLVWCRLNKNGLRKIHSVTCNHQF
jgi:hypothetical protein